MNHGPLVVFLGPSLPHDVAREILPGVVCLPPAAMGDILGAVTRLRPRAIGLVDGTFLANMSVFHKEILYAMDQGVWMLGASSMGALRAAECAAYGMIGVGDIYAAFASGEVEDDDEVALTHGDESTGFTSLSDALVTIRATIFAARDFGLLSAAEADTLIAAQKTRWFPERRLSNVARDAQALGIAPSRCKALNDFVRSSVVDPKRADAILLLERMTQLPDDTIPENQRPRTVKSGAFTAMLARDVVVETSNGMQVTFDRIRRYAALHDPKFDEHMRHTRQELALASLSLWIGGLPSEEERELAVIRIAHRVGVSLDSLDEWAQEQDIDSYAMERMVTSEALVSRLEFSWLGRSRMGAITANYMQQVRISGDYLDLKAAAALQQTAAKGVILEPPPSARHLIASTAAQGTWQIPRDFVEYLDRYDFGSFEELLDAMSVSIRAHHSLFGFGLVDLPEDQQSITVIDSQEPMMSRGH